MSWDQTAPQLDEWENIYIYFFFGLCDKEEESQNKH